LNNFPKISIVTPNYNQGEYLEQTIRSVLDQGYPNLEYIIIDGGSTDSSLEIIKKYEKQLTYWISEKDNGMYEAIQKGFERSTGEIMGWINSDDILFPSSLKRISSLFNSYTQIEWLGGCALTINSESDIVYANAQRKWNRFMYYTGDFKYIQQEGTFWRRSLWLKAGGSLNTSLKFAGDLELWSRFFLCADYYTLPTPLAGFRMRRENQKTLDNLPLYFREANLTLNSIIMSEDDKRALARYRLYLKVQSQFPLLGKIIRKFLDKKIFKYPSVFQYDVLTDSYLLKNDRG